MFDQEQEHWDYEMGCQSELQNAYDLSRMEMDTVGDSLKIKELIEQDKFVIVEYVDKFCPRTDAYIALVEYLIAAFDTIEEANEYLYSIPDKTCIDSIGVRFKNQNFSTEPSIEDIDDVPF